MVALVGGAVTTLGAVLDWSGVGYVPPHDRELAAGAGAVAGAIGLVALRLPRLVVLAVLPALVGLNMGVVNFRDVSEHRYEFAAYPSADVGIGLYLVLAGASLLLATAIAGAVGWRRAR